MFEIGNSLREARLRQGLDFPELEQTTKIRSKYLRALEDEQFQVLPAQTYVKGFLRSYAESLGLDGQLYVDEYNSRYVTGEDEPVVKPRRSTARPRLNRRFEARAIVLAVVGIGVVVTLVVVAAKFGGGSKQHVLGVQTSHSKTSGLRNDKPAKAPARRHRAALVHVSFVAANGPVWLAVHRGSAAGPQVFQGTVPSGQHYVFTGRRFWVDIGAPSAVVVKLNGRPTPLPGAASPQIVVVTAKGIEKAPSSA